MSDKMDFESEAKRRLMTVRGVEVTGGAKLTEKQRDALEEGKRKNNAKHARLVIQNAKKIASLAPSEDLSEAQRQLANLEFLFRQLSSEDKRKKDIGGLVNQAIGRLRETLGSRPRPMLESAEKRRRGGIQE